jgi:PAS domain-containing protein
VLYPESPVKLALILSLPLTAVLALLFVLVIHWERKSIDDIQINNMLLYSRSLHQHIITSPIWRGPHSGHYIEMIGPVGEKFRDRQLLIMGKEYRRIDPLSMGPQFQALLKKRSTYRFHITSLESRGTPNRPDEWELEALVNFRDGEMQEDHTSVKFWGTPYFRYVAPIPLSEGCLRCHGGLTAGLSIDIPIDFADRLYAGQLKKSSLSFALFGFFILVFVMGITWFFSKRISDGFKDVKRLNEQLIVLSMRDKKMLESIVDGIAIISPFGRIDMVNPTFARLVGRNIEDLIDRDVGELEEDSLKRVLGMEPGQEVEIEGRIYTVTDISVSDEEKGQHYGKLRILHDATQEKLSAAMELAGATAHEMRQPLAILLNLSSLVKDKVKAGEDPAEELKMFESQCERINEIITKMLSITQYKTRKYAGEMRIFDLGE